MALTQHPEKIRKGVIEDWHPEDKVFGKRLVKRSLHVIYGFLFLVYFYHSASGCFLVPLQSI